MSEIVEKQKTNLVEGKLSFMADKWADYLVYKDTLNESEKKIFVYVDTDSETMGDKKSDLVQTV